jgi:hypothetical protein
MNQASVYVAAPKKQDIEPSFVSMKAAIHPAGEPRVLFEHFAAVEHRLLCSSRVPGNAGHAIYKGAAREAFVLEFLLGHLRARTATGTGEIIDASSIAGAPRNQIDIVISISSSPKASFQRSNWVVV